MKRMTFLMIAIFSLAVSASLLAQPRPVPHIFEWGDKASSKNFNENFKTLYEGVRANDHQIQKSHEKSDATNKNILSNQEKIQQLNSQLSKMQKQVNTLESELEAYNKKLNNQLGKTKEQLKAANALRKMAMSSSRKSKVELAKIKEQMEQTNSVNRRLEEYIRDASVKIADLETKGQELEDRHKNLRKREQLLNKRIKQTNTKLIERQSAAKTSGERQEEIFNSLRQELESGKIKIKELSNRIAVRIDGRLLFDSGKNFVKASGIKILNRIGKVLKKIHDKHIQVEGHTDNLPIGTRLKKKYVSNWELSVARAVTVARYLVDYVKIDPKRISSAGFGEFQPIASNKTVEGRRANRRIEFTLLPIRGDSME